MKRFICLFLVLVLLPVVSLSEFALSELEKSFVGSWYMFATNKSGKIYSYNLVFLDSMKVYHNTMTFENGLMATDHNSSGEWAEFVSDTIIFTLSGTNMCAKIRDNGYLYLYFFDDLKLCAIYTRCEDMTAVVGW